MYRFAMAPRSLPAVRSNRSPSIGLMPRCCASVRTLSSLGCYCSTCTFPPKARSESRYVHRRGHDLIAEENENAAVTWYTPDDITALLLDAGFRDVTLGESP